MVFGLVRSSKVESLEKRLLDLQKQMSSLQLQTTPTTPLTNVGDSDFTAQPQLDYSEDVVENQLIKDYLGSKDSKEAQWRYSKLNYYRRQSKTWPANIARQEKHQGVGSNPISLPDQPPKDLVDFLRDVIKVFPIPHNKWMDLFGITPEKLSVEAAKFVTENQEGLKVVWSEAVKPWLERWTTGSQPAAPIATAKSSSALQPIPL